MAEREPEVISFQSNIPTMKQKKFVPFFPKNFKQTHKQQQMSFVWTSWVWAKIRNIKEKKKKTHKKQLHQISQICTKNAAVHTHHPPTPAFIV